MIIFKILIIVVIAGVGIFGRKFWHNQNVKAHLGGKISNPKIFWLCYTVYSWFFIPLFLAWVEADERIKMTLLGWAILFWVRGVAEMFMLYKWKNWRPPYGISHDVICFLFMVYMQLMIHPDAASSWSLWWIRITTACMIIEVYYAYAFYKLCRGNTMGKDGIWFADPHDPAYKRINLVTTLFNWPLYLHVMGLTLKLLTS